MKPESICVSLETAKRLKEAGWDKETVFVWIESIFNQGTLTQKNICVYIPDGEQNRYPAPTSAEIELPHYIEALNLSLDAEVRAAEWLHLKEDK